jgi:hypothetical protein
MDLDHVYSTMIIVKLNPEQGYNMNVKDMDRSI